MNHPYKPLEKHHF